MLLSEWRVECHFYLIISYMLKRAGAMNLLFVCVFMIMALESAIRLKDGKQKLYKRIDNVLERRGK